MEPPGEGEIAVCRVRVVELALQGSEHRAVVAHGVPRLPLDSVHGFALHLNLRVPLRAVVDQERGVRAHHERRCAFDPEQVADVEGEAGLGRGDRLQWLELELRLDGVAEGLGRGDFHLGVVDVRE